MSKKWFQVTAQLSIRTAPSTSAQRLPDVLSPGTQVEVETASRREADGLVWWRHSGGWSAERRVDGAAIYMQEILQKAEAAAAKRSFRVTTALSIRTAPSVNAARVNETGLLPDTVIEVLADSRREADGFIWWQHDLGWSAQGKVDGTVTYLEVVETTPATITDASPQTVIQTQTIAKVEQTGTRRAFRVMQVLSIRAQPGLSAQRVDKTLAVGTVIEVSDSSRREVDGFVWWQHSDGWSAERKVDNSVIFLGDPTAQASTNSDGTVNVDGLPNRDSLFQRLPVDFGRVQWIQYFGNTKFAFENGRKWSYHTFAQGLHAGLDLGNNNPDGLPVYAGVQGIFKRNNRFGIAVQVGEYLVIYQHLHRIQNYVEGGQVTPDTILGEMDKNNHLHLEIRFDRERWIVNPLLLLPPALRDAIMNKYANYAQHFYPYSQWQTPLDQPVIQLGGPVIGPTA